MAFAPENLGVASPMIRHRVDNALKQVGMYHYRTHAPHLLSGGQTRNGELGLPVKSTGFMLPCGAAGRWTPD